MANQNKNTASPSTPTPAPVLNEAALEEFQRQQEAETRGQQTVSREPVSFGSFTAAQIEELAATDPIQALNILTLKEKLSAFRIAEEDRAHKAKFTANMVKEVFEQQKMDAAGKKACEMQGHRRENGTCALGGQYDSNRVLVAICVRCQMVYHGVGEGPEQLPRHFLAQLDPSEIGG